MIALTYVVETAGYVGIVAGFVILIRAAGASTPRRRG